MFQEMPPFHALPPIKEIASYARMSYAELRKLIDGLSHPRRNEAGKITRPAYIALVKKDGLSRYDFTGLYRACRRFLSADSPWLRSPVIKSFAGMQRQPKSIHIASPDAMEQEEEAQPLADLADPIEEERTASASSVDAPALSAACVDLLSDALKRYEGNNLLGLLDYASIQLTALDASTQLTTLEWAAEKTAGDVQRNGRGISNPIGILRGYIEQGADRAKQEIAQQEATRLEYEAWERENSARNAQWLTEMEAREAAQTGQEESDQTVLPPIRDDEEMPAEDETLAELAGQVEGDAMPSIKGPGHYDPVYFVDDDMRLEDDSTLPGALPIEAIEEEIEQRATDIAARYQFGRSTQPALPLSQPLPKAEPGYWLDVVRMDYPKINYQADDDTWHELQGEAAWQQFKEHHSSNELDSVKAALGRLRVRAPVHVGSWKEAS